MGEIKRARVARSPGRSASRGRCVFFQAEDGIRDYKVTGVQTCALPICGRRCDSRHSPKRARPASGPDAPEGVGRPPGLIFRARPLRPNLPDTRSRRSVGARFPPKREEDDVKHLTAMSLLWACLAGACLVAPGAVAQQAGATSARAPLNTLTPEERAAGWKLLFDGHSTLGWRGGKMDTVPAGWGV